MFPSLFEKVVQGSLTSFFQSVDISLYLMEATALCHSKGCVGLKPSWCTLSFISLFGFLAFKTDSISGVL